MHILHVFDHSIPLASGYTYRSRAILGAQRERGWSTSQITGPKQGPCAAACERVDGLEFHRTRPAAGPLAHVPVLEHLRTIGALERRLDELVATRRPDILHAHSPALDGVAALRVGRRRGIPVLYECRAFWEDAAVDHGTSTAGGPRYRLTRALESYVFRSAQAVTTICDGLRADIEGRGIAPGKVTVIPNAVDASRFEYAPARNAALAAALGVGPGPVIGFIGSFYAYEGLDLLVGALPGILARFPGTQLLLVGGGNESDALARQVRAAGLERHVIAPGRVSHERIADYYSLLDILVYPRMPIRLTELVTPLKPLEAMAHGVVVAASDVGGHRELVAHGETGFLFTPGSSEAIAACVLELLDARASWDAVRERARRHVERERSWGASVARYEPVYRSLIDPARAA